MKSSCYNLHMKSRYEHRGVTWIDLENPTRHEVIDVAAEFNLDAFTAEELLAPSLRPHVEVKTDYTYLILHFPALKHAHRHREQEIDFVVGRQFIITAHYDTIDPLHKFAKVFEVNTLLEMEADKIHAGHVFFFMVKRLYKAVEHEVEYVRRELANIEEHIFSEHQVAMVSAISRAARNLLNLRQTIEPHRDVLKSLETDGTAFFGHEFQQYLRGLEGDYYRVHNHIMRNTESLHELRETNNSLLTTKQNETMKIFTIMAFVTFPLSLIVIILDMDSVHNPIHGLPYDFWIVIGVMAFATLCMFTFFKKKNWL
jgi:magnesium transporter